MDLLNKRSIYYYWLFEGCKWICWIKEVYTIIDYLKGASGFVDPWKKYILLLIIWRVQVDLLNKRSIYYYWLFEGMQVDLLNKRSIYYYWLFEGCKWICWIIKKYILLLIIWRVQVDLLNKRSIYYYWLFEGCKWICWIKEVYTIIDYLKGASGFVE